MKLAVVILNHNQEASIEPMLAKLIRLAGDRFWVLDRCADSSKQKLSALGELIIENTTGERGFLAGRMRDIAIEHIMAQGSYDTILFLDGDRIPLKPIRLSEIRRCMRLFDVALCTMEAENRPYSKHSLLKGFLPAHFITCGFIVKTFCLSSIKQLPLMNGRCFHEEFDGGYGYEDCFLGYLLNLFGYKIGWSSIKLSGGIVFDSFQKMRDIKRQLVTFDKLCRQVEVS